MPCIVPGQAPLTELEHRLVDLSFGEGDHRLAVGRLVAGRHQGVGAQWVVVRCGARLLDQGADDPGLGGGELFVCVHPAIVEGTMVLMPRRSLLLATAAVFVVVVALVVSRLGDDTNGDGVAPATSTSTSSTTTTTSTTTTSTTTTTTTTIPPGDVAIAGVLASLGDRELAQQLVVFGGSGPVETAIERGVGDLCVGGVFVTESSGNWAPASSPEAATAAVTGIIDAAAGCAAPPIVATDAEVGTQVLRVPVDPLPSAADLEANHLAEPATTDVGLVPATEAFAGQLAALGIDVNFGVVADVDADEGLYMQRRGRTFGADPAVVSAIADALVTGHCAAGVAPTLKHFPNQGSTPEDPHVTDSFSVNDPDTWRTVGAVPYRSTRAPLVMVGHIRYPEVEDGTPATLSRTIITGWLRTELAYDGVIVTDDLLAMRGVGDLTVPERAVAALAAGADLALFVAAEDGSVIVDAIVARMGTDAEFAAQVHVSAERVLRLKGALGLLPGADPDWFTLCGSGP